MLELIYSDRNQVSVCLGRGVSQGIRGKGYEWILKNNNPWTFLQQDILALIIAKYLTCHQLMLGLSCDTIPKEIS